MMWTSSPEIWPSARPCPCPCNAVSHKGHNLNCTLESPKYKREQGAEAFGHSLLSPEHSPPCHCQLAVYIIILIARFHDEPARKTVASQKVAARP